MQIFLLQAPVVLTKSYTLVGKTIEKSSYPNVYEVTSIKESCTSMQSFAKLLTKHAALGHCLVKGELQRDLVKESRAGTTVTMGTTDWICLDIDGVPGTVEDLLFALSLYTYSYVVQYSASYLIADKLLRCHVFMQLDKPMPAPLLKQWLIGLNFSCPKLDAQFQLTKSGNALHWPLDITACQNDKLLYIAPPVLNNIADPIAKRIQYVAKPNAVLSIKDTIPSTEANKHKTENKINELRVNAGLPKRKFTYKHVGQVEVLVKPTEAVVTAVKRERGFVYFNLNGGDSWGYYHAENNPDYIFNFKGEPAYLTKELLPSYWSELCDQGTTTATTNGLLYLAFWDRKSGVYYCGHHDQTTGKLCIDATKNETQLRHYCKEYGIITNDFISRWDIVFDPHSITRVDVPNHVVNLFEPTSYMLSPKKKVIAIPPNIDKIITHVLNDEGEIKEHFLNWLAFIIQKRDRTGTAWVFHGVQGTGKGVMFNQILQPLIGQNQSTMQRMEVLDEKYNDYMEQSLLVFIDEVEIQAMRNKNNVVARVKNFIVEPNIQLRRMYSNSYIVPNYTNWMLASNQPDVIAIDETDRRFNIAPYQSKPLDKESIDFNQIPKELQAFYHFLNGYKLDEEKAHTPIKTQAKNELISLTQTSAEAIATALEKGDFTFFMDQVPSTERYIDNMAIMNALVKYKEVLLAILGRTKANGASKITRDELQVIFEYLQGTIYQSPNKFTMFLKHLRITPSTMYMGTNMPNERGVQVCWLDMNQRAIDTMSTQLAGKQKPNLKVVK